MLLVLDKGDLLLDSEESLSAVADDDSSEDVCGISLGSNRS